MVPRQGVMSHGASKAEALPPSGEAADCQKGRPACGRDTQGWGNCKGKWSAFIKESHQMTNGWNPSHLTGVGGLEPPCKINRLTSPSPSSSWSETKSSYWGRAALGPRKGIKARTATSKARRQHSGTTDAEIRPRPVVLYSRVTPKRSNTFRYVEFPTA